MQETFPRSLSNLLPEIAARFSTKEREALKFHLLSDGYEKLQKEKLEMHGTRYANIISWNETDVLQYDVLRAEILLYKVFKKLLFFQGKSLLFWPLV